MAYFRVIMQGSGVCLPHNEKLESALGHKPRDPKDDHPIIGFFTTRLVPAQDADSAIKATTELIINEWTQAPFKDVNTGSLPVLSVDVVQEIEFIEYFKRRPTGFTFYTDEDGVQKKPG